jgi:diguanylate cyclase (GGDEF)-like protein/PAS domain S-box-containing protein
MRHISLLILAYFLTGWLGLQIPYVGSHITLVWLPTGIAVAALLRWGWRVWPGVFVGAVLVNLSIGSPWLLAASIAVGNTLGPLLSTGWLKRGGFHCEFDRQKDVGLFISAAMAGMAVSASCGVACLYWAGLVPLEAGFNAWLSWWLGDTVGVLLAVPLLVTLSWKSIERIRHAGKELSIWLLIASLLAWFAFINDDAMSGHSLPLALLTLPLFAWAALRFGKTGAALAGLCFSVIAAWSTAAGHGPFIMPNTQASLLLLWSYMATTVLTGLLITALLAERRRVEGNLRASEIKLRGLYELSPLGIALADMDGRYVEFNQAFQDICGYSADELKAVDYWTLTPRKYAADEARQLESLERTGRYGPYEKEYIRKDGSLIPLRLNGMLITGDDGQRYIWSLVEDITDSKRLEADLRVAATAFESQEGIMVTNAQGVILRINKAFIKDTGYTVEEVVGKTPRLFNSGQHEAAFYEEMWQSLQREGYWQGEIRDRRKNGEIYPKWMTITAVKNEGVTTHYVSTHNDITQRKLAEDEIKLLAFYDPLTGLPNRRLLLDRLHQALANSARSHRQGALIFIDLDNFKTLNDTLGHPTGDMLLQQVAQRLSACAREGDTVARLGGDEFVVMLENLSEDINEAAVQLESASEKFMAELNRVYSLGGRDYYGTSSMGVTVFGKQDETVDGLLKQADLAMYQAKASGRNSLRFFDPQMQAVFTARATLETELRHAVREGQLVLYYQPQVDPWGHSLGAEALVRWQHPQRGLVLPNDFIPLAEETGLIMPLGFWVLEAACTQLSAWAEQKEAAHLTLAVNISVQQIHQPDFVEQVLAVLDHTGANPKKLKLELTESLLMDNVEDTIAKMIALKARGVGFALDDFGTGYSSFSYLKRLPLEKLKIDRSFVMDVLTDPNDAAITQTIVALAQSMNLSVIAEGVETEAQRDFLNRNGCHEYQGYLFSRPLPVDAFEQYLKRAQRSIAA